ncbi:MAG: hypothetical protein AAGC93_22325 [Cyanobacteria bacterium P01_F01_bin.53]
MFGRWVHYFLIFLTAVVFFWVLSLRPASAATFSFKTEGNIRRDGLLTGELVYSDESLQKAIQAASDASDKERRGATAPIPLSKLEGAQFKMSYTSPYSGLEHTEKTLCGKEVYDINGYEESPLAGNMEPMLVLAGGDVPEFIDFSSCVGSSGDVTTSISKRDSRIAFSTADSLFGRLTVFDKDASGGVLYRKIQPIKFSLKP